MDIAFEVSRILADQALQEIKSSEDEERVRKPILVVEVDPQDGSRNAEADAEETRPFGLGFVKGMKSMHTVIKYFLTVYALYTKAR